MNRNARNSIHCLPMLALVLAAVGCGGEPIDEDEDVDVDVATNVDDAEQALAPALPNLKPKIVVKCTGNKVQWEVKNHGAGPAAASVSGITWDDPAETVYRAVPALGPGKKYVIFPPVLIPPQPDGFVGFHVTADIHKKVIESNENDNVVGDYCDWN